MKFKKTGYPTKILPTIFFYKPIIQRLPSTKGIQKVIPIAIPAFNYDLKKKKNSYIACQHSLFEHYRFPVFIYTTKENHAIIYFVIVKSETSVISKILFMPQAMRANCHFAIV